MMIKRERLKTARAIYTYLKFQLKLAEARLRDWADGRNPEVLPIPPAHLRYRVHGSLDKETFLKVGRTLVRNISDLCAAAGRDLHSFEHILDFGCGCGRVLRYFGDAPASCRFYGTDIDAELVGWCERHLAYVEWTTNGFHPPLTYADDTFDLIYAISVFTHLDEEYQHAWLAELRRVARPGAVLILTVHGQHCINMFAAADKRQIDADGFIFKTGTTGRLKLDKLPDFYQTAYHTEEYIRREWSAYFDVIRYAERGINNNQDAVLLRKP